MELLHDVARSPALTAIDNGTIARSELSVMRAERVGDRVLVTEGVIDLALDDGTSWRVVDWKTDVDESARLERYSAQVSGYATLLEAITGRPATGQVERVLARDSATP